MGSVEAENRLDDPSPSSGLVQPREDARSFFEAEAVRDHFAERLAVFLEQLETFGERHATIPRGEQVHFLPHQVGDRKSVV